MRGVIESLRITLREALEINRSDAISAAGNGYEELAIGRQGVASQPGSTKRYCLAWTGVTYLDITCRVLSCLCRACIDTAPSR